MYNNTVSVVVCSSQLNKQPCGHFIDKCSVLLLEQHNITSCSTERCPWERNSIDIDLDAGSTIKRLPDGEDNTRVSPTSSLSRSLLTSPSLLWDLFLSGHLKTAQQRVTCRRDLCLQHGLRTLSRVFEIL